MNTNNYSLTLLNNYYIDEIEDKKLLKVNDNFLNEMKDKFNRHVQDKKLVRAQYSIGTPVNEWNSRAYGYIRSFHSPPMVKQIFIFLLINKVYSEMTRSGHDNKILLKDYGFEKYGKCLIFYLLNKCREVLNKIFNYMKIDEVIEDIMSTSLGKEILDKLGIQQLNLKLNGGYEGQPWLIDHKLFIINKFCEESNKRGMGRHIIDSKNKRRIVGNGNNGMDTLVVNRYSRMDSGNSHEIQRINETAYMNELYHMNDSEEYSDERSDEESDEDEDGYGYVYDDGDDDGDDVENDIDDDIDDDIYGFDYGLPGYGLH